MDFAHTYNELFSFISAKRPEIDLNKKNLLSDMLRIYKIVNLQNIDSSYDNLYCFDAMSIEKSTHCIGHAIETLKSQNTEYNKLNLQISYLLDELICNIQQHSMARIGLLSVYYDDYENKSIDICVADDGIGVFGSYVNSSKYLDMLENGDADAICLAREGYSTKNLPETENRGYGISSNAKWIVDGLDGEFSIISGKALDIENRCGNHIFSLPENIEWPGTMISVRIPVDVPDAFNIYNYIS